MILAALQQVDKAYGDQLVLEESTLELRDGGRTALVGCNGAGKTTVLRLLMRKEPPDSGRVFLAPGVTMALLDQAPTFDADETVASVADQSFEDLDRIEAQLQELERAGLDAPERYAAWEPLHATFERRGGYLRRSRREAVLDALGFRGRSDQPVHQLSGGERTRLGLAQLLMAQPDVLLLDEPTNHLDIDMRAWLESYLVRYPGAAILVSHDREFLDGACDQTAEVGQGRLEVGPGNPSTFRAERAEARRIQEATRKNQEKELARLDTAARQMKKWAGQNAKLHRRAKAMEKRVERYSDTMVEEPLRAQRNLRFSFDADESGDIVLTAQHLSKRFDRPLFEDVSVELRRGQRVALVGPNGAGKTTLLRMILGDLASDDARALVRTGSRVRLGYYDQKLGGVNPEATLIEEMIRMLGDVEAHNMLGRFMFPYDAQYKLVKDLSGGERARLALLKLTIGRFNLLVLDEPTNHLDVEMIEALEDALQAYEGTLLLVSHDRRFLAALLDNDERDRVWEVRDGKFEAYLGGWSFQQRARRERQAVASEQAATRAEEVAVPERPQARRGPSRWQLEQDIQQAEETIAELEGSLEEVSRRLAAPQAETPEALVTLGRDHAALETDLLAAMATWEDLSEQLGSS